MKCKPAWIYESPDNGKTVYRRPFGDYDTQRELVSKETTNRIRCPECKKDLGEAISCDLNTIGWYCIPCNIKIYKMIEN